MNCDRGQKYLPNINWRVIQICKGRVHDIDKQWQKFKIQVSTEKCTYSWTSLKQEAKLTDWVEFLVTSVWYQVVSWDKIQVVISAGLTTKLTLHSRPPAQRDHLYCETTTDSTVCSSTERGTVNSSEPSRDSWLHDAFPQFFYSCYRPKFAIPVLGPLYLLWFGVVTPALAIAWIGSGGRWTLDMLYDRGITW